MENQMFCFQCEQTAGCTGCMAQAGVCGKPADVAQLQDRLTGALISFACALKDQPVIEDEVRKLYVECLFTTVTNVNFNAETVQILIDKVHAAEEKYVSESLEDFDMDTVWKDNEDIRSLKSLILFGLRGMAAYAYHARVLGYTDESVDLFFIEGLRAIQEKNDMESLLPVVMGVGEHNYTCMALLDRANTETYGTPEPTVVPLMVEKGPFIVVSGHDLYDLKQLLEQTKDKGINIYTHGEMLPAHSYPELKKYPHLKGNFGTAWQNQQKEFMDIPAPVLFTTNCLMPPRANYKDRM